jgi:DNA polymerase-1
MTNDTIILVDAYAQIYRGFFAVRNLTNSKGQATNAVFVMAKFLLKLHSDHNTPYGAFLFDVGKPAFRLEIAPAYKANRPPMPDDLRSQVPHIKELATAFGWKIFSQEGYEADDLIAAMADEFQPNPVTIISGDKDLSQIVSKRVTILTHDRNNGGFESRGVDEIQEKFGVKPSQIVDYLAMLGDSSDNIPGVPGIGAKTAAALLKQHGSIEKMLESPGIIENEKVKNKLVECAETLKKNIKLITLKTIVPEKSWQSLQDLKKLPPDWRKIADICEQLELRTILKDIPDSTRETDLFSVTPPEEPIARPVSYTPDLFGDFK